MKMLKPQIATLRSSTPMLMQSSNPSAEKRTRGRKWMSIRERWFSEHPLCVMCQAKGRTTAATRLDHIVPLIDGGRDDESNYQSLCASCHDEKTAAEAKGRGGSKVWSV